MDIRSFLHLKTLLEQISSLPLQIVDSLDADFSCIDNGLRTQFENCVLLYDNMRKQLSQQLQKDVIIHMQDSFCLHYVIFLPDPACKAFCVLGPFLCDPLDGNNYLMYLQQNLHLPEFPAETVLNAAQCMLALFSDTPPRAVSPLYLRTDPTLLLRLSVNHLPGNNSVMWKLIHYIQTHLHQKLTLQTLSEYCGFSPTYISHRFKEEIGLPPMQYIILQRITHAKYLLRTTDKPIKEIAQNVGLPDCSYFTKLFREQVGATPSEYRNTYL